MNSSAQLIRLLGNRVIFFDIHVNNFRLVDTEVESSQKRAEIRK